MSTTNCIAGNDVKNNGATVMLGGNAKTTERNAPVTNVAGMSVMGAGRQDQPGPVYEVDNVKANTDAGSTFATLAPGAYIVKGLNITTTLANVANDTLTSGGTQKTTVSIHEHNSRRTVLIDSWNYVTGDPTYNASNPSNDSFGSDVAAAPSRAIPGYLVYAIGENVPTATAYEAKTG